MYTQAQRVYELLTWSCTGGNRVDCCIKHFNEVNACVQKPAPLQPYRLMLNITISCWSIHPEELGLNSLYHQSYSIPCPLYKHFRCLLIAHSLIGPQMALSDLRNLCRVLIGSRILYLNFDHRNLFPIFVPGWQFLTPQKSLLLKYYFLLTQEQ